MSLGHDAGLCGSTWSPAPIWKWVRFSRTSRSVSEESGWYLARVKTSHMVTPNDQTSLLDENLPCMHRRFEIHTTHRETVRPQLRYYGYLTDLFRQVSGYWLNSL